MMNDGLLVRKTLGSFRHQLLDNIEDENQLLLRETEIQQNAHALHKNDTVSGRFIADHLGFNSSSGVDMIEVRVFPLKTYYAIRRQ